MKVNWKELQKPIVLEARDWDNEKYLFKKEVNKAYNLVEQFHNLHTEYKNSESKNKEFDLPMNISIVGERGSGKTSVLKSLKNKLEAENYYVFDIIDPNLLASDLNILEILISNIYKTIAFKEVENVYFNEKIISKLKTIMTSLSIKRQGESFFKKDNPSIDILDKINDVVELDKYIESILEDFLAYLNVTSKKPNDFTEEKFKNLVLIIDDLDLVENNYIHRLLTQIHEHLNTKIIIIFAYRESQLSDALFNSKLEDNQNLIEKNRISLLEIDKQVENILLKLISLENRIYLYSKEELLKKDYKKVFGSLNLDEENLKIFPKEEDEDVITVEDWIYEMILRATNLYIKPYDNRERALNFLPNSLREFIQLAEVIDSLENIDIDELDYGNLNKNIVTFTDFFINRIKKDLNFESKELIADWMNASSYQKNYLSYHYFLNKIDQDKIENIEEYPYDLRSLQNYNLRLGDVFEIMEQCKAYGAKNAYDFFMVYVIKLMYSLELMNKISLILYNTKRKIDEGNNVEIEELIKADPDLESYLQLINTNFMPKNFNYFGYTRDRDDEDYIVNIGIKSSDKGENDENELISNEDKKEIIRYFINTPVTAKGDLRKGIYSNNNSFKYRSLYSFDINVEIEDRQFSRRSAYPIEYYSPMGQKPYVIDSLKAILNKEDFCFILFSMFQIDNFVRVTYSRQSQDNKYRKVIRAIDSIFDKINSGKKDRIIESKYFGILGNRTDRKYLSPYQYKGLNEEGISKDLFILKDLGLKFEQNNIELNFIYKGELHSINNYRKSMNQHAKREAFRDTIRDLEKIFKGNEEEGDKEVKGIIKSIKESKFYNDNNSYLFNEYIPKEIEALEEALGKYI